MSDSLYSLQSDIQRLALQQTQIQNLMNTAAEVEVGVVENKQGHPLPPSPRYMPEKFAQHD